MLAGRENRKEYGLKPFTRGVAPMVLLSVARYEIRRFSQLSLAFDVPLDQPFSQSQNQGYPHRPQATESHVNRVH